MAKLSIVRSHAVPLTSRLVGETPRPLITNVNPQTANPPYPILFYDQVQVACDGEQAFRSEAFTNNTGRPIELHSLRIQIKMDVSSVGDVSLAAFNVGGIIALEMEIGGVPITRGAVPVWHLCRSDNRRSESFNLYSAGSYCWYFSQPIPVMPGKGLKIQAKHLGGVTFPAAVSVSVAGRVSPKAIPNRIPFVAAWTSRAFSYTEVASDSVPPNALANDTGRDLTIDRIIGRSIAYDNFDDGEGPTGAELTDFNDYSTQGVMSFLIRLGVSQNRPILRAYTPWRAVFGQNAAIETDFILRKQDYLTGTVSHIAGPPQFTALFSQNRGSLSIVGWREA